MWSPGAVLLVGGDAAVTIEQIVAGVCGFVALGLIVWGYLDQLADIRETEEADPAQPLHLLDRVL